MKDSWHWYQDNNRFENLNIFRAMHQRYLRNHSWEQTQFFQNIVKRLSTGEVLLDCTCEDHLVKRYKAIDQLYSGNKQNGYKSQQELNDNDKEARYSFKYIDAISVNINGYGQILFNNSVHRPAIAKILNIKKVPVVVTVRHAQLDSKQYTLTPVTI